MSGNRLRGVRRNCTASCKVPPSQRRLLPSSPAKTSTKIASYVLRYYGQSFDTGPPEVWAGSLCFSVFVDFRSFFDPCRHRNPSRSTGFDAQCILHQKSAPDVHSKAHSWPLSIQGRGGGPLGPPLECHGKCAFLENSPKSAWKSLGRPLREPFRERFKKSESHYFGIS